MKLGFNNKRGDFATIVYVVIFLFIIGTVIFIISHMNNEIFTEIQTNINTTDYQDTEAYTAIGSFIDSNASSIWDYAFLGIFFGSLIAIGLSVYAIRISPAFYWVFGVMSLMVLGLGVVLSNAWQEVAGEAEFAVTLTRFPITNALLGTYYPLVTTAIIILTMVLLFSKPKGQQEGFL